MRYIACAGRVAVDLPAAFQWEGTVPAGAGGPQLQADPQRDQHNNETVVRMVISNTCYRYKGHGDVVAALRSTVS